MLRIDIGWRAVALFCACSFAASGARGDGFELIPAIATEFGYDSNIARTPSNKEDDGVFRLLPQLTFRKPRGDLTFDASYQFAYEKYLTENVSDGDDHFARLTTGWRLSERTQLTLQERFAYTENLNDRFDTGEIAPGDTPDLVFERDRFTANNVTLGLSHQLRPRWQLETSATHGLLDGENRDRWSGRGSVQTLYLWTPRLSTGFGGMGGYDSYEGSGTRVGNRTVFGQGFLVVRYQLRPDISLEGTVGPAWRQTTIGPSATSVTGGDREDQSIDVWGSFALTKAWQRADAAIRFSRSNAGASSDRSDSVLNSLSLSVGWLPSERWRVDTSANWSLRKGDSSFGGISNDEETNTFLGQARVRFQLTKRASFYWLSTYRYQDEDRDVGNDFDIEDFRVFMGFQWTFEPIQL